MWYFRFADIHLSVDSLGKEIDKNDSDSQLWHLQICRLLWFTTEYLHEGAHSVEGDKGGYYHHNEGI